MMYLQICSEVAEERNLESARIMLKGMSQGIHSFIKDKSRMYAEMNVPSHVCQFALYFCKTKGHYQCIGPKY